MKSIDARGDGSVGGIRSEQDVERFAPPLRRSAVRALVQDFGPIWFTWAMNAGIISLLLHELPYRFSGLFVLSNIFMVFDFVAFFLASLLLTTRLLWFRSAAYNEITGDVSQLCLLACWAIAFITLPPLIASQVSTTSWGGPNWTYLAYALWWAGVAAILGALFFVFGILITRNHIEDKRMPLTIALPAVGSATLAVTGALVTISGDGMTARLAVPVIVVGYMTTGIGLIMALILYAYLFHALLTQSWPEPPQTVLIFIFVGPMGQCAAALQLLASSARTHFPTYMKGTFLTAQAVEGLSGASIMFALLLQGMAFVWFFLSVGAVWQKLTAGKLKWSIAWNSIIFPTATLTTSSRQLATEMDSPAWRVITCLFVVLLVAVFLLNLFMSIWKIWQGELLIVREDPRVKAKIEEMEKGK